MEASKKSLSTNLLSKFKLPQTFQNRTDLTYNQYVDEVNKILSTDPTLSLKLKQFNFTENEYRYFVENLIKKDKKYKQKSLNFNVDQAKQKKLQKIAQWDSFYSEYMANLPQDISDLAHVLQMDKNNLQTKLKEALYSLNLHKDVLYNQTKGHLEYIKAPNSSGTSGMKFTSKLLRQLVLYLDDSGKVIRDTNIIKGQKNAQIMGTDEYKFLNKIINLQNNIKSKQKIIKNMKRSLKPKNNVQETSKRINSIFSSQFKARNKDLKKKLAASKEKIPGLSKIKLPAEFGNKTLLADLKDEQNDKNIEKFIKFAQKNLKGEKQIEAPIKTEMDKKNKVIFVKEA